MSKEGFRSSRKRTASVLSDDDLKEVDELKRIVDNEIKKYKESIDSEIGYDLEYIRKRFLDFLASVVRDPKVLENEVIKDLPSLKDDVIEALAHQAKIQKIEENEFIDDEFIDALSRYSEHIHYDKQNDAATEEDMALNVATNDETISPMHINEQFKSPSSISIETLKYFSDESDVDSVDTVQGADDGKDLTNILNTNDDDNIAELEEQASSTYSATNKNTEHQEQHIFISHEKLTSEILSSDEHLMNKAVEVLDKLHADLGGESIETVPLNNDKETNLCNSFPLQEKLQDPQPSSFNEQLMNEAKDVLDELEEALKNNQNSMKQHNTISESPEDIRDANAPLATEETNCEPPSEEVYDDKNATKSTIKSEISGSISQNKQKMIRISNMIENQTKTRNRHKITFSDGKIIKKSSKVIKSFETTKKQTKDKPDINLKSKIVYTGINKYINCKEDEKEKSDQQKPKRRSITSAGIAAKLKALQDLQIHGNRNSNDVQNDTLIDTSSIFYSNKQAITNDNPLNKHSPFQLKENLSDNKKFQVSLDKFTTTETNVRNSEISFDQMNKYEETKTIYKHAPELYIDAHKSSFSDTEYYIDNEFDLKKEHVQSPDDDENKVKTDVQNILYGIKKYLNDEKHLQPDIHTTEVVDNDNYLTSTFIHNSESNPEITNELDTKITSQRNSLIEIIDNLIDEYKPSDLTEDGSATNSTYDSCSFDESIDVHNTSAVSDSLDVDAILEPSNNDTDFQPSSEKLPDMSLAKNKNEEHDKNSEKDNFHSSSQESLEIIKSSDDEGFVEQHESSRILSQVSSEKDSNDPPDKSLFMNTWIEKDFNDISTSLDDSKAMFGTNDCENQKSPKDGDHRESSQEHQREEKHEKNGEETFKESHFAGDKENFYCKVDMDNSNAKKIKSYQKSTLFVGDDNETEHDFIKVEERNIEIHAIIECLSAPHFQSDIEKEQAAIKDNLPCSEYIEKKDTKYEEMYDSNDLNVKNETREVNCQTANQLTPDVQTEVSSPENTDRLVKFDERQLLESNIEEELLLDTNSEQLNITEYTKEKKKIDTKFQEVNICENVEEKDVKNKNQLLNVEINEDFAMEKDSSNVNIENIYSTFSTDNVDVDIKTDDQFANIDMNANQLNLNVEATYNKVNYEAEDKRKDVEMEVELQTVSTEEQKNNIETEENQLDHNEHHKKRKFETKNEQLDVDKTEDIPGDIEFEKKEIDLEKNIRSKYEKRDIKDDADTNEDQKINVYTNNEHSDENGKNVDLEFLIKDEQLSSSVVHDKGGNSKELGSESKYNMAFKNKSENSFDNYEQLDVYTEEKKRDADANDVQSDFKAKNDYRCDKTTDKQVNNGIINEQTDDNREADQLYINTKNLQLDTSIEDTQSNIDADDKELRIDMKTEKVPSVTAKADFENTEYVGLCANIKNSHTDIIAECDKLSNKISDEQIDIESHDGQIDDKFDTEQLYSIANDIQFNDLSKLNESIEDREINKGTEDKDFDIAHKIENLHPEFDKADPKDTSQLYCIDDNTGVNAEDNELFRKTSNVQMGNKRDVEKIQDSNDLNVRTKVDKVGFQSASQHKFDVETELPSSGSEDRHLNFDEKQLPESNIDEELVLDTDSEQLDITGPFFKTDDEQMKKTDTKFQEVDACENVETIDNKNENQLLDIKINEGQIDFSMEGDSSNVNIENIYSTFSTDNVDVDIKNDDQFTNIDMNGDKLDIHIETTVDKFDLEAQDKQNDFEMEAELQTVSNEVHKDDVDTEENQLDYTNDGKKRTLETKNEELDVDKAEEISGDIEFKTLEIDLKNGEKYIRTKYEKLGIKDDAERNEDQEINVYTKNEHSDENGKNLHLEFLIKDEQLSLSAEHEQDVSITSEQTDRDGINKEFDIENQYNVAFINKNENSFNNGDTEDKKRDADTNDIPSDVKDKNGYELDKTSDEQVDNSIEDVQINDNRETDQLYINTQTLQRDASIEDAQLNLEAQDKYLKIDMKTEIIPLGTVKDDSQNKEDVGIYANINNFHTDIIAECDEPSDKISGEQIDIKSHDGQIDDNFDTEQNGIANDIQFNDLNKLNESIEDRVINKETDDKDFDIAHKIENLHPESDKADLKDTIRLYWIDGKTGVQAENNDLFCKTSNAGMENERGDKIDDKNDSDRLCVTKNDANVDANIEDKHLDMAYNQSKLDIVWHSEDESDLIDTKNENLHLNANELITCNDQIDEKTKDDQTDDKAETWILGKENKDKNRLLDTNIDVDQIYFTDIDGQYIYTENINDENEDQKSFACKLNDNFEAESENRNADVITSMPKNEIDDCEKLDLESKDNHKNIITKDKSTNFNTENSVKNEEQDAISHEKLEDGGTFPHNDKIDKQIFVEVLNEGAMDIEIDHSFKDEELDVENNVDNLNADNADDFPEFLHLELPGEKINIYDENENLSNNNKNEQGVSTDVDALTGDENLQSNTETINDFFDFEVKNKQLEFSNKKCHLADDNKDEELFDDTKHEQTDFDIECNVNKEYNKNNTAQLDNRIEDQQQNFHSKDETMEYQSEYQKSKGKELKVHVSFEFDDLDIGKEDKHVCASNGSNRDTYTNSRQRVDGSEEKSVCFENVDTIFDDETKDKHICLRSEEKTQYFETNNDRQDLVYNNPFRFAKHEQLIADNETEQLDDDSKEIQIELCIEESQETADKTDEEITFSREREYEGAESKKLSERNSNNQKNKNAVEKGLINYASEENLNVSINGKQPEVNDNFEQNIATGKQPLALEMNYQQLDGPPQHFRNALAGENFIEDQIEEVERSMITRKSPDDLEDSAEDVQIRTFDNENTIGDYKFDQDNPAIECLSTEESSHEEVIKGDYYSDIKDNSAVHMMDIERDKTNEHQRKGDNAEKVDIENTENLFNSVENWRRKDLLSTTSESDVSKNNMLNLQNGEESDAALSSIKIGEEFQENELSIDKAATTSDINILDNELTSDDNVTSNNNEQALQGYRDEVDVMQNRIKDYTSNIKEQNQFPDDIMQSSIIDLDYSPISTKHSYIDPDMHGSESQPYSFHPKECLNKNKNNFSSQGSETPPSKTFENEYICKLLNFYDHVFIFKISTKEEGLDIKTTGFNTDKMLEKIFYYTQCNSIKPFSEENSITSLQIRSDIVETLSFNKTLLKSETDQFFSDVVTHKNISKEKQIFSNIEKTCGISVSNSEYIIFIDDKVNISFESISQKILQNIIENISSDINNQQEITEFINNKCKIVITDACVNTDGNQIKLLEFFQRRIENTFLLIMLSDYDRNNSSLSSYDGANNFDQSRKNDTLVLLIEDQQNGDQIIGTGKPVELVNGNHDTINNNYNSLKPEESLGDNITNRKLDTIKNFDNIELSSSFSDDEESERNMFEMDIKMPSKDDSFGSIDNNLHILNANPKPNELVELRLKLGDSKNEHSIESEKSDLNKHTDEPIADPVNENVVESEPTYIISDDDKSRGDDDDILCISIEEQKEEDKDITEAAEDEPVVEISYTPLKPSLDITSVDTTSEDDFIHNDVETPIMEEYKTEGRAEFVFTDEELDEDDETDNPEDILYISLEEEVVPNDDQKHLRPEAKIEITYTPINSSGDELDDDDDDVPKLPKILIKEDIPIEEEFLQHTTPDINFIDDTNENDVSNDNEEILCISLEEQKSQESIDVNPPSHEAALPALVVEEQTSIVDQYEQETAPEISFIDEPSEEHNSSNNNEDMLCISLEEQPDESKDISIHADENSLLINDSNKLIHSDPMNNSLEVKDLDRSISPAFIEITHDTAQSQNEEPNEETEKEDMLNISLEETKEEKEKDDIPFTNIYINTENVDGESGSSNNPANITMDEEDDEKFFEVSALPEETTPDEISIEASFNIDGIDSHFNPDHASSDIDDEVDHLVLDISDLVVTSQISDPSENESDHENVFNDSKIRIYQNKLKINKTPRMKIYSSQCSLDRLDESSETEDDEKITNEVNIVFPASPKPESKTISYYFNEEKTPQRKHFLSNLNINETLSPKQKSASISNISVIESELSPPPSTLKTYGSFLCVADIPGLTSLVQKDMEERQDVRRWKFEITKPKLRRFSSLLKLNSEKQWAYKVTENPDDATACKISVQVLLDPSASERTETETFEYEYYINSDGSIGEWVLVDCTREEIVIFIELLKELIAKEEKREHFKEQEFDGNICKIL